MIEQIRNGLAKARRLAAAVLLLTGAAQAAPPSQWQAVYTVRQGSIEGGEAAQSYQAADGHYRLTLDVTPGGVVALFTQETFHDESSGKVDQHGWQPQRYVHLRQGGKKQRDYEFLFDWQAGQVREAQGDTPPARLSPGTLDELVYVEALRRTLAAGGTGMTAPVLYGSDGEIRDYTLETLGEEDVTTPAGTFHAVKVRRTQSGGKYTVTLWCAPQLDYFPVRIDREKRGRPQGTLLLKRYQGGGRSAPASTTADSSRQGGSGV
ncbi:DUF3108 domain-containing protein [Immundisolibacter sp.]|uniref:DUF3108 domain-containing protein n=1 Tax=Immundisolibacter sp. TaxID=1934948 RepID=UPI0026251941|nr:DUF3108 domain-containing protein [Immundisolibacter sp.]MDD3650012.1 DUF3108 domain-containing protein [Immundisolibacter sp.]